MFPNYKKRLFGKRVPDGWTDLGARSPFYVEDKTYNTIHSFCRTTVHVGKTEHGELFIFYPRCMILVEVPNLENDKEIVNKFLDSLNEGEK